jgi:hypothetical protein
VAPNRNSQAVHFVKRNALHRTGLSVGEDHGFAKELALGLLELAEDRSRARLRSWPWWIRNRDETALSYTKKLCRS